MSDPGRLQSIAGPITIGYGYGMFTGTCAGHAAYYHPGDDPGLPVLRGLDTGPLGQRRHPQPLPTALEP
jgi:hypothetical protein